MITGIHHRAPSGERSRALVIMLAGVGIEASEFSERGLVGVLHERNPSVDVIATRPDLDLYLDGNLAAALHRDVVDPARMQGYARLWLLGISLGGMGALHYASIHPGEIEGIILLAPFLGTQGTVAEISAAGGLASWSAADSACTAVERRVLLWLKDFVARRPEHPALYLGYGCADRFAEGHRMLAELMPSEHVVTTEGGHDWPTWLALWRRVLDATPLVKGP